MKTLIGTHGKIVINTDGSYTAYNKASRVLATFKHRQLSKWLVKLDIYSTSNNGIVIS